MSTAASFHPSQPACDIAALLVSTLQPHCLLCLLFPAPRSLFLLLFTLARELALAFSGALLGVNLLVAVFWPPLIELQALPQSHGAPNNRIKL